MLGNFNWGVEIMKSIQRELVERVNKLNSLIYKFNKKNNGEYVISLSSNIGANFGDEVSVRLYDITQYSQEGKLTSKELICVYPHMIGDDVGQGDVIADLDDFINSLKNNTLVPSGVLA